MRLKVFECGFDIIKRRSVGIGEGHPLRVTAVVEAIGESNVQGVLRKVKVTDTVVVGGLLDDPLHRKGCVTKLVPNDHHRGVLIDVPILTNEGKLRVAQIFSNFLLMVDTREAHIRGDHVAPSNVTKDSTKHFSNSEAALRLSRARNRLEKRVSKAAAMTASLQRPT